MPTSGPDLLVAAFLSLAEEEQREAFGRLHELLLRLEAGHESEASRHLNSMLRVTEELGHVPSVDEYKETQPRLAAAGEDVETFARVYRHYGNWARAREAVELSATTTARRIEARFRSRRVGKVWRYTEDTLREALEHATEHWERPPSVAEFEWWRERELELAEARGEDLHLPTSSPYRKRWGTWEAALLHFGYTPEQVALRLEGKIQPHNRKADPYLPHDLPIAQLEIPDGLSLPLKAEQAQRMVAAYERLARRSRYVLTARFGLDGQPVQPLRAVAEPLVLSISQVHNIEAHAIEALASAAAGEGRRRPRSSSLRGAVRESLQLLASGRLSRRPRC